MKTKKIVFFSLSLRSRSLSLGYVRSQHFFKMFFFFFVMSRIMNSRWVGERRRSEEFREENSLGHVNCFTRPSKCANWTELLGDNTSKTILSKNSKKNIWQLSPCSELIRWINAIFLVFLRLTFGSRSCVPCLFSLSLFLVQRDRSRERNGRERAGKLHNLSRLDDDSDDDDDGEMFVIVFLYHNHMTFRLILSRALSSRSPHGLQRRNAFFFIRARNWMIHHIASRFRSSIRAQCLKLQSQCRSSLFPALSRALIKHIYKRQEGEGRKIEQKNYHANVFFSLHSFIFCSFSPALPPALSRLTNSSNPPHRANDDEGGKWNFFSLLATLLLKKIIPIFILSNFFFASIMKTFRKAHFPPSERAEKIFFTAA